MKGIHVVHILDSMGMGGLEKGITTVASNATNDINHSVICLRHSGPLAEKLPPSVKVIELNKPTGNSLPFILKLSFEIRRLSPSVVHTRGWGGMDGIIAANLVGVRKIIHGEHGWDLLDAKGASKKRRLLRRLLSHGVREYTCVSQQIKEWLENDVRVCRPVNQIYNGVDADLFTPEGDRDFLRSELGLDDEAQLLGIVARLDPIKDHRTLLDAFSMVAVRRPDAHLVIIGDGPERNNLERLAGERVHFLGNRGDVQELLRGLDLFVLSSLNEGISNTVLEAMASGVPVVASRVGGNPELVRDGIDGALFAPGNAVLLGQLMETYLANGNRRRRQGRSARARVKEYFSIPAMVSQYEALWRRIAKGE